MSDFSPVVKEEFTIDMTNDREIDILFEGTWNFDLGMGIRIVNEKVTKVGVQNEVL